MKQFDSRFKNKKKGGMKIDDRFHKVKPTKRMGKVKYKFGGSDYVPLYKHKNKMFRYTTFSRHTLVPFKGKSEPLKEND